MLGKITPEQEKIILHKIYHFPDNCEYEIVHIGAGIPATLARKSGTPINGPDFRLWSRSIHLAQCEEVPHHRGGNFRTLKKKINVKYTDLYQNHTQKDFRSWGIEHKLRSEEVLYNRDLETTQTTGKQYFCHLDILNIDLPDGSVDMLIAVGLFSKFVPNVWKNLGIALSEAYRVLKDKGELILTLHSDYFWEFHQTAMWQLFDIEIIDRSPDNRSEGGRTGERWLLVCKKTSLG